jgi:hypothetical protein
LGNGNAILGNGNAILGNRKMIGRKKIGHICKFPIVCNGLEESQNQGRHA